MSGGFFDYRQNAFASIVEAVGVVIDRCHSDAEYDRYYDYSDATIKEIENGLKILKQAYVYAQRIDWLVSGDDGEDTFHKRLKADLVELQ